MYEYISKIKLTPHHYYSTYMQVYRPSHARLVTTTLKRQSMVASVVNKVEPTIYYYQANGNVRVTKGRWPVGPAVGHAPLSEPMNITTAAEKRATRLCRTRPIDAVTDTFFNRMFINYY